MPAVTSQTNDHAFESPVESMLIDRGWHNGDRAAVGRGAWRYMTDARYVTSLQPSRRRSMDRGCSTARSRNFGALLNTVETLLRELDSKVTARYPAPRLSVRWHYVPPTILDENRPIVLTRLGELDARIERNDARKSLSIFRDVHPESDDTLDLVFALDGVEVATCELKNPMTGQTWEHAVRQYQQDRDPYAPIFRFPKRALVHFAADPDAFHHGDAPCG